MSSRRRGLMVGGVLLVILGLMAVYFIQLGTPGKGSQSTVHISMTTFNWGFNVTDIPNFQEGHIYYPNPTLTVHIGQRVVIELRSLDITHGFAIDEFGVNAFIPPGQTVKVNFVADRAGNFTYYCNVFCGTGHPYMHGILQVLL
jgi:heme/copper-type cytochrome/quinol oxidase subunit 2